MLFLGRMGRNFEQNATSVFDIQQTSLSKYKLENNTLTVLKTKYENTIDVEKHLRLYMGKQTPDIQHICEGKQAHPSHQKS